MEIKLLQSMWGWKETMTPEAILRRAKEAGFAGIDGEPPLCEPEEWKDLRAKYGMKSFILVGNEDLQEQIRRMKMAASFEPDGIISHTGSDVYTFEEGAKFMEECLRVEDDLGVPVYHETHRGKLLHHPRVTAQYVQRFPTMKINADFAHFVLVCESLLEGMAQFMEPIIGQCFHIHARVGWQEASQVADPRAPEFAEHLQRYEQWWDAIKAAREADGTAVLHLTPEFGPFPYMPELPYTRQPIADLWDVNEWMAGRFRERWGLC